MNKFTKAIAIIATTISFNAQAATWELVNSEYSPGNGWLCTYQLQGTNYVRTILQQSICRLFVYN